MVIIGCGGHASDVLSVIEACDPQNMTFTVLGYLDDDPSADDHRLARRGLERIGALAHVKELGARVVPGVGYPAARHAAVERLRNSIRPAPPIIHPSAQLATGARVHEGTVVFDGVTIGPFATVGRFAMLGRGVVVGHDAEVGDYASLMPGSVISGDVAVGGGALVGANATVLEGRKIGEWARLGSGAVLTTDLPAGETATGIPARLSKRQD